jgi:hypothetical protein
MQSNAMDRIGPGVDYTPGPIFRASGGREHPGYRDGHVLMVSNRCRTSDTEHDIKARETCRHIRDRHYDFYPP